MRMLQEQKMETMTQDQQEERLLMVCRVIWKSQRKQMLNLIWKLYLHQRQLIMMRILLLLMMVWLPVDTLPEFVDHRTDIFKRRGSVVNLCAM